MKIAVSAIIVSCAGALVATCPSASASPSSTPSGSSYTYTYVRHYIPGEVSQYSYTQQQAGQPDLTAAARLKSYIHDGIGGEQVKWVSLFSGSTDLSAQAQAFPPYNMSLDPKDPNGLTLPDTQNAGQLQNPVDDLFTLYGGLSPAVGIGNLHQPGDSFVEPTLLHGNFSSATAPVGQDLVQATTTLTSLTGQQATFAGSFQPPAAGGLQLTAPFMSSPVCGSTPNNFELVQQEGTQYLAIWGCESFTTTIVVDRPIGRIVSGQIADSLQVDLTFCQDQALTQCGPIQPTTLQRNVTLTRDDS